MNRSTCWSCEWFIYLSFNLSSYSIYLCVELETFVPGDGWTAWGVFPWHFNGLRRLLIPCCSSLCQAIEYKTSCRSPRWHTQLGCAAPMWIHKPFQSNKPKSSHYIEGYCIHTDNMATILCAPKSQGTVWLWLASIVQAATNLLFHAPHARS